MRSFLKRLWALVRLSGDVHHVVYTLGGGALVTAVAGAVLDALANLPTALLVLALVGVFLMVLPFVGTLVRRIRRKRILRTKLDEVASRVEKDAERYAAFVGEFEVQMPVQPPGYGARGFLVRRMLGEAEPEGYREYRAAVKAVEQEALVRYQAVHRAELVNRYETVHPIGAFPTLTRQQVEKPLGFTALQSLVSDVHELPSLIRTTAD